MSDLVFSLEAAKQGKTIKIQQHKNGWIQHQDIGDTVTIHEHFKIRSAKRQQELANEIFKIPPC